jgi:diaminopropionate ammonia-lyase
MAGYTQLMHESAAAWGAPPDVVIVQAGVGSLAGAVAGWLHSTFGADRPRLVVVEPDGSACVLASLEAGNRTALSACAPTSMTGLRCGDVSPLAWPVLQSIADAALTVSDAAAADAVRRLGQPVGNDPSIDAGPSGAAGIAGLVALAQADAMAPVRDALGLSATLRAFAIITEGE